MFDEEESKGVAFISRPLFELPCTVCHGAIFPTEDARYDPNTGWWTHKTCYITKDDQLSLF
jgi:hypothetical protein